MELQHLFTVPAPVGTTWETFMDLAGVAECFPGATVTSVEGDRFEGTCKVKLGPIALLYAGSGTFVERDDERHRAVIEATGKDKRGNGTAGATVTIALTEAPAESAGRSPGTSVDVTTDLKITGKPAQFGRGVMQDVSDKLLQQFVACLETKLGESPAEAGAAEPESAGSPGAAESMAASMSPEPQPPAASAPADISAATTPTPAKPTPAAPTPANVTRPAFVRAGVGGSDDAIDLGSTVLPALLRSYAPHLIAAAVGFVLGALVMRSRRR